MKLSPQQILITLIIIVTALPLGIFISQQLNISTGSIISPFISQEKSSRLPLLKYTIPNLARRNYQAVEGLTVIKTLPSSEGYSSYIFSYITLGKKVTGQLNVPASALSSNQPTPLIVMLRGWAPIETYQTGMGTKNAAAFFANNGFATLAPDFLGYGDSDPEPDDGWEARFIKPIIAIELLKTIENYSTVTLPDGTVNLNPAKMGLWGHSNGGQVALSVLEILNKPLPTTLWAPVTAPFPYSVLFFSDEHDDEGKAIRLWLAQFEQQYDVLEFSITQYLSRLTGPLLLHHGTADEAALKVWSDEFVEKIEAENERRETQSSFTTPSTATDSAPLATQSALATSSGKLLPPIDITYHVYPGANHNLQPSWNTVVQRDVTFFRKQLSDK